MKALVLDATYYPVQIIDWKKAMILFFTERAEVVDYHENIEIRSTSASFRLPKVLRLFQKAHKLTQVKFNRANVFYRDKFTCQYCSGKFKEIELTLDHVLPKSRGGQTSWENIVTSCHKCNNKKADRTPQECGLKLPFPPKQPNWSPMMAFRLSKSEKSLFENWFFAKTG
ncbi:MAG: HNH endonuclease [Bacteriovoracaceae bacterium]